MKIKKAKKIHNEQTKIIDNEWYTFVSNDNSTKAENENQFEEDQLENNEIKEGNELQPSICYKSFPQKVSLEQAELNDATEEPYDCKTCKKQFHDRSNWKKHEKIHF